MLFATLLTRAASKQPCTVVLAPDEWTTLGCLIQQVMLLPTFRPTLGIPLHRLA